MARYAADYPQGPHDKPQIDVPGLRQSSASACGCGASRRSSSGSACCVYGLTFVSHFYGARRSVGYVPFSSETLVTGKLFEDIREAVHAIADPAKLDAIVVTNLCVPTASGVPLRLLPKEIDGVRVIGIDVPGFGVPTHAEAKDVLAGAMLAYARKEAEAGPVQAPDGGRGDRPTVTLLGEMFPADPVTIGRLLAPMDLAAGPVVPCREWRELYGALDGAAVAAIHPFYTASIREFERAGRPVIGSAPVGRDGTVAWLRAIADALAVSRAKTDAAENAFLPAIDGALAAVRRSRGGSPSRAMRARELLVARLLVESGATVPYVGTACPRTRWSEPDRDWLEAKGTVVKLPRLARGRPRRHAGRAAGPRHRHDARRAEGQGARRPGALLHQPHLRPPADGAGRRRARSPRSSMPPSPTATAWTGCAPSSRERGTGDTAGIWQDTPADHSAFRTRFEKKLEKQRKAAKAAEMI